MTFFDSNHCRSNLHCKTCREQTPKGIAFRIDMKRRFSELTKQDYACPYGREWGFVGLGDRVASIAQPVAGMIDAVLGTSLKTCGGCATRKGALNKLS